MDIYLIRHGQTTGDLEDRYGGDYDDPLTPLGKQQAMKLSKHLQDKKIKILYTSPKIRARETADILSKQFKIPIKKLPEFSEQNRYSVLTGLIKSDAAQRYPEEISKIEDIHSNVTGSEDYQTFNQRVLAGLEKIHNDPHNVVAIVTHAGPIRMILREVLQKGEFLIEDCGYIHILFQQNHDRLIYMHAIKHRVGKK